MTRKCYGFALVLFALSACAGTHDAYDQSAKDRSVQMLYPGTYIVSYREFDVIEKYGPGVESVRDAVRQATGLRDKTSLWDQAVIATVPKYLVAAGLVPIECRYGVAVIRCGSTEGGGGWAEFRCK